MTEKNYRRTNLDYLPEYPSDWELDRIKDKTTSIVGGDWGQDPDSKDEGIPVIVLRVADMNNGSFNYDNLTIRKVTKNSLKNRKLNDHSLIIEKSGGGEKQIVGRVSCPKNLKDTALCSNFMAKIDFKKAVDINFMNYLFFSLYNTKVNFQFIQQTTGIQNLNVGQYLNTKVAFPSFPEQKAIADYLDKATAKIDRVIEIKERQLEKIQSYLKSKFYEILTKGTVVEAFKDSGINWIDKVPIHWHIRRLKDIVNLKSGESITSNEIAEIGEYPVYGGNGIRGRSDSYTHNGFFALIGRQGALCGNINYAQGKFWASEHAVVATPILKCDIFWIGELMRIMNLNMYSNAAAQPGLAVERIKQIKIPYPELEEQQVISNALRSYLEKKNIITNLINQQIKLLKSFRKSLIHEYVTGKKRVWEGEIEN